MTQGRWSRLPRLAELFRRFSLVAHLRSQR
jgi:hypothetical protein